MARYKPVHRDPLLLPVTLAEQIQPGTFEFALDHLVDHELDVSGLDARFRNDRRGEAALQREQRGETPAGRKARG